MDVATSHFRYIFNKVVECMEIDNGVDFPVNEQDFEECKSAIVVMWCVGYFRDENPNSLESDHWTMAAGEVDEKKEYFSSKAPKSFAVFDETLHGIFERLD